MTVEVLDAAAVRERIPAHLAMRALGDRLRDDPPRSDRPLRTRVPVDHGQLLLMPDQGHEYVGVKVVSLAPGNPALSLPTVQGVYLLMDAATLTPRLVIDAAELTLVRTAAVTMFGIDRLLAPKGHSLVVIGSGPQAVAHVEAAGHLDNVTSVTVLVRSAQAAARMEQALSARGLHTPVTTDVDLGSVDVVVCCTSAREPLFAASDLQPDVVVAAIGSHEPDARELPTELLADAYVVVESHEVARREAGDVIIAEAELGRPVVDTDLVNLVHAQAEVPRTGRRVWKTVGEAWQDLSVASVAAGPIARPA